MNRFWRWLRDWRLAEEDYRPCSTPWWEDRLDHCHNGLVPIGVRNTYSSLGYALAGLTLWLRFGTPESIVMAFTLGLLGIGSAVYHAVPGRVTAALDHAGMYATFGALATYAAGASWIPMLAAAVAGTVVFELLRKADLNAMMGLFLWVAGVAGWEGGSRPLVIASGAVFAGAMTTWQMDRRRVLTARWGHAAWHVLTAAAIALMYAAQAR